MQAVAFSRYGSSQVLKLINLPKPYPQENQVLIKVHAAGVNPQDWKIRSGSLRIFYRVNFPFTPGFDVAGKVVQVGKKVKNIRIGDRVVAMLWPKGGGYAEHANANARFVFPLPSHLTFIQGAALPGSGLTAYQALMRKDVIRKGMRVLVYGASGGVGTFTVMISKSLGAIVTGITGTKNLRLISELGADEAVDYTKTNVSELPAKFQLVFDAVGKLRLMRIYRQLVRGGTYISVLPNAWDIFSFLPFRLFAGIRYIPIISIPNPADLGGFIDLVKTQKITPYVGHTFPLSQARKAHELSESTHARGKIVLEIFRPGVD